MSEQMSPEEIVDIMLLQTEAEAMAREMEGMSTEDVLREIEKHGFSREQALAEAKERAAQFQKTNVLSLRRVVVPMTLILAAAAAIALVLRKREDGPQIVRTHDAVDAAPQASSQKLAEAAQLRERALRACANDDVAVCHTFLDLAAGLDPDGERDPRVVEARAMKVPPPLPPKK